MRAPFPSLLRFYVLSTYGLRGSRLAPGSSVGEKRDPVTAKAAAKAVGIALLVILVVADITAFFFGTNYAMYRALKPAGLQGLLILNAATSASFLVFFLGFTTALSTYCVSSAENILLTLPVKPHHLLGAKFITVYLSECLLAFLLMTTAYGIYAWGEHPGALFYAYALIAVLALPLIPIAISYLILVPLMSLVRFLRNKNAVMIIGGFVGVAFAIGFNFLVQSASARLNDPAWILANYAGPDAFLAQAGKAYLPALLIWKAASSAPLAGLGYAAANLGLGIALALLAVALLGPAYASSLSLFGETRLKKLKAARGFIDRKMKARPLAWTLFLREFRLMNREPIYFLNGPFIVLLMPVIIAIMVIAQGENLAELTANLAALKGGPYLMLVAAAAGTFLGSSTSITCTSISRDAKVLPYLKSLPLPMGAYVMAKYLHGFAFSVFGALVGSIGLGIPLGLSLPETAGAMFIALALSALVDIAGLWLDTFHPRLVWDTPTAALKQNVNSVVVILGTMGFIGTMGVLASLIKLDRLGFILAYGLAPAILTGLALVFYARYAERKLPRLEG